MKCELKPKIHVLSDVPLVGNPTISDISPAIGGRPTGTFTADQLKVRLEELHKKRLAGKAHAEQLLEQLEKGHTGTLPVADCDREVTYLFPGTRVSDGVIELQLYSLTWIAETSYTRRVGENGWTLALCPFPHGLVYPVDKYRLVVIDV